MSKKKALKLFAFALLLVGGLKFFTTTTYAQEYIDYRSCPLDDEGFKYHRQYHSKYHKNGMMYGNYYNEDIKSSDLNKEKNKNNSNSTNSGRGYYGHGMCHWNKE